MSFPPAREGIPATTVIESSVDARALRIARAEATSTGSLCACISREGSADSLPMSVATPPGRLANGLKTVRGSSNRRSFSGLVPNQARELPFDFSERTPPVPNPGMFLRISISILAAAGDSGRL